MNDWLAAHPAAATVAAWYYVAVLATANHYWLDVITATGVLALAYALAASLELARRHRLGRRPQRRSSVSRHGSLCAAGSRGR